MQTFLLVAVILILMAPLLLFYGAPFIVLAALLHRPLARRLTVQSSGWLSSGVAALGIAPAFDSFCAPKSIYLRLLEGDRVAAPAAVISLAATWLAVWLAATAVARLRAHARAGSPAMTAHSSAPPA